MASSASPLLSLPPELRLLIYEALWTPLAAHINASHQLPASALPSPHALALLLTCRKIYAEAHRVAYTSHTFLLTRDFDANPLVAEPKFAPTSLVTSLLVPGYRTPVTTTTTTTTTTTAGTPNGNGISGSGSGNGGNNSTSISTSNPNGNPRSSPSPPPATGPSQAAQPSSMLTPFPPAPDSATPLLPISSSSPTTPSRCYSFREIQHLVRRFENLHTIVIPARFVAQVRRHLLIRSAHTHFRQKKARMVKDRRFVPSYDFRCVDCGGGGGGGAAAAAASTAREEAEGAGAGEVVAREGSAAAGDEGWCWRLTMGIGGDLRMCEIVLCEVDEGA